MATSSYDVREAAGSNPAGRLLIDNATCLAPHYHTRLAGAGGRRETMKRSTERALRANGFNEQEIAAIEAAAQAAMQEARRLQKAAASKNDKEEGK